MKKKKSSDKKNIIIIVLTICVLAGGLLNILNELADKNDGDATIYSASNVVISDGDFSKNYSFEYNSSYIKVEEDIIKKEIKIIPIKSGKTSLKINYVSVSGENKSVSYEIKVLNELLLKIDNK